MTVAGAVVAVSMMTGRVGVASTTMWLAAAPSSSPMGVAMGVAKCKDTDHVDQQASNWDGLQRTKKTTVTALKKSKTQQWQEVTTD